MYVSANDTLSSTDPLLVPKMAIVQDVSISDRKQTVDVGTMVVLH